MYFKDRFWNPTVFCSIATLLACGENEAATPMFFMGNIFTVLTEVLTHLAAQNFLQHGNSYYFNLCIPH